MLGADVELRVWTRKVGRKYTFLAVMDPLTTSEHRYGGFDCEFVKKPKEIENEMLRLPSDLS